MKCKFGILVFQEGKLDEEVETIVHEFANWLELTNEMIRFAAMNSNARRDPAVGCIIAQRRAKTVIQEPKIRKGLGPETYLVISKVISVE